MARIPLLAAALLGTALFSAAPAQVQAFGDNFPRMSTRLLYFGETGPLGQICIQYGQPEWKAEYDQMLTAARGTSQRLGRDFWTSLDTDMDLTIGGTKVPAGQWYLGLRIDEEGSLQEQLKLRCERDSRDHRDLMFVLTYLAVEECVCDPKGTCVICAAVRLLRNMYGIENYTGF